MGHLEGNFTPVLYIGRKVPKGYVTLRRTIVSTEQVYVYSLVYECWQSHQPKIP